MKVKPLSRSQEDPRSHSCTNSSASHPDENLNGNMNESEDTGNKILKKVLLLHVPILFCLYMLTDHGINSDGNMNINQKHLAVFTALARHPPSMRIFRGLLEVVLLGFCAAFSLYVYEQAFTKHVIAKLLFEVPYTLKGSENSSDYQITKFDETIDEEYDDDEHEDDYEIQTIKQQQEQDNNYQIIIPTTASILNGTLDLLLLILISLFLFTFSSSAGGQYIDQTNQITTASSDTAYTSKTNTAATSPLTSLGDIAAPVFPILLCFICAIKAFFPWNKRRYHFWTVMSYTISAPMYQISFRDGFVGDIFTSMVRPLQDIAFTMFYLFSGLQGWWIYRDQTTEEDIIQPVENSWLLHTVVLPACMLSPLWWRYCQTLRQCYEHKTRWPYLGNSFKYFFAAQVVLFGVFDPGNKNNTLWLTSFILATLYQLVWDVFMDWELFVWDKKSRTFEMRRNRLYTRKSVYIAIFILNILLRFCWTLNFLPVRYLSPTGALLYTFSADFSTFISPTLACAEIIRRTVWGFLRFELEVIKVMSEEESDDGDDVVESNDGIEMKPMVISSIDRKTMSTLSSNIQSSSTSVWFLNDFATSSDVQILWELCVYATIFTSMGIISAVHRGVM